METNNNLPENVGAAVHPQNKNYIMFTTFDASPQPNPRFGEEDQPEFLDILDLPNYKTALAKLVTVMEYEYFQSIVESYEGDVRLAAKTMYLPQTIRKISDLPEGFEGLISNYCEDFGDETMAIVRFFEFDQDKQSYYPVDVQFAEDGSLLQADEEE